MLLVVHSAQKLFVFFMDFLNGHASLPDAFEGEFCLHVFLFGFLSLKLYRHLSVNKSNLDVKA